MATILTPNFAAEAGATDERRARLLIEAANELLDENGLEGLTIRAVLAHTGLARRAFYEQFGSKDDLVLAVFEATLRAASEQFRAMAEGSSDPVEALGLIVTGIVIGQMGVEGREPSRRSAALSREHLRLAESRPNDLQAALKPLIDIIAAQIEKGVRMGLMRPCDPRWQASLVYNLVAATTHVELLGEEGDQPDIFRRTQLASTIWEFCRRAVIA